MPEQLLIQLKDVVKKFNKNLVLSGVNLTINNKDIYGIIGTSGSGKTTILNLIIGFLKTNGGSITYDSKNISVIQDNIHQTFGFASQGGSYYNKLNL